MNYDSTIADTARTTAGPRAGSQQADGAFAVTYRRDMLGRVIGVGDGKDPFAFARYSYDAHGKVTNEDLVPGRPGRINRRHRYDPLGHLVGTEDPFSDHSYSYRAGGGATGPYLDGSVTAETLHFKQGAFPAGKAPRSYRYDYMHDPFGRFKRARASDPSTGAPLRQWDAAVEAYDADNSLLAREEEGKSLRYEREQGTHQVSRIVERDSGATRASFEYDPDGAVRTTTAE